MLEVAGEAEIDIFHCFRLFFGMVMGYPIYIYPQLTIPTWFKTMYELGV